MTIKLAFIGRIPDADPSKHKWAIEISDYKLFTLFVKNQEQAIEVAKMLVKDEDIDQITLCPGYTHKDVAEIVEAVGDNVAVAVARRDGPSNSVFMQVKKRKS